MEINNGTSSGYLCKSCKICNGYGCKGQLPGMGGINNSRNFILNYNAWKNLYEDFKKSGKSQEIDNIKIDTSNIAIAPVTGAVQNIGLKFEKDFYMPYFSAAKQTGIAICVGDGAPDEKLELGHKAVCDLGQKAYFFFKPYPDEILFKRIDFTRNQAIAVGMDIDAYNIVTMRNQAKLEKKTNTQIEMLHSYAKLPFMLKGIFSKEDIELCKKVYPDIAVVSNHGGRVQTDERSSAEFLKENIEELKTCCKEIWVDGGLRTQQDIKTALYLGAKKVLIARPFIAALCKGGTENMKKEILNLLK